MEDLEFVPRPQKPKDRSAKATDTNPMVIKVKIKPTWADIRYNLYTISDALVIAPAKDRKFANDIISVIKCAAKATRRTDLEAKKQTVPAVIYEVDEFKLEIENKQNYANESHYQQPQIVTVIDRKTGKIIDRITKPFLVARVVSAILKKEDDLIKSQKKLEALSKSLRQMVEFQIQNQK